MRKQNNKPVTFTLRAQDHYDSRLGIVEGEKVFLSKNLMLPYAKQIKRRHWMAKLLNKKWKPCMIIQSISNDVPYAHTLTLKPNF